jgi:hypothetical protein
MGNNASRIRIAQEAIHPFRNLSPHDWAQNGTLPVPKEATPEQALRTAHKRNQGQFSRFMRGLQPDQ